MLDKFNDMKSVHGYRMRIIITRATSFTFTGNFVHALKTCARFLSDYLLKNIFCVEECTVRQKIEAMHLNINGADKSSRN